MDASFIASTGAVSGLFSGEKAGRQVEKVIEQLREAGMAGPQQSPNEGMQALMKWSGFHG